MATSLFFTLLVFYLANFYGVGGNPYVGIIAYLILPGIFFLGLILIPLGMVWKHRRESRQGQLPKKYPDLDFNRPELRRVFSFIVLVTTINGIVLTHAS